MADLTLLQHYGPTPGDAPGLDAYFADAAHNKVHSVQPDGSLQTRPADAIGGYESGKTDGQLWSVNPGQGTIYTLVLADLRGL